VFFDRAQDRLHLIQGPIETLNTPLAHLCYSDSRTALKLLKTKALFFALS
jgi:hypothetical protein